MIRNAPGQEVCVSLMSVTGGYLQSAFGINVSVKRRGLPLAKGAGIFELLETGKFCYYPQPGETDSESVTFFFSGGNAILKEVTFHTQPGTIEPPPNLTGKDCISRVEFLEMTADETVFGSMGAWVAGLLHHDPIPLTPRILAGLNRAYPRLFKLTETKP